MRAMKVLKLQNVPNGEVRVEGCHIRKCTIQNNNQTIVYTTTPRVPGGKVGFLRYIAKLVPLFPGNFIVFDRTIDAGNMTDAEIDQQPTIKVLTDVAQLNELLGIVLTPEQVLLLNRQFFDDRPAAAAAVAHEPRQQQQQREPHQNEVEYSNRFMEAMMAGRLMDAPGDEMFVGNPVFMMNDDDDGPQPQGPVMGIDFAHFIRNARRPRNGGDDDQEDEEFLLAQEESLRQYELEQQQQQQQQNPEQPPPRLRRKIDDSWEKILKDPEVLADDSPHKRCCACLANRATIVFVECSHMEMCDSCVRDMFSLPGVNRVCPVCRGQVEHILRPYW